MNLYEETMEWFADMWAAFQILAIGGAVVLVVLLVIALI